MIMVVDTTGTEAAKYKQQEAQLLSIWSVVMTTLQRIYNILMYR